MTESSTGQSATQPEALRPDYKLKYQIFEDFLTPEECDHLIKKCMPRFQRSKSPAADGSVFRPQDNTSICNNLVTWLTASVENDPVLTSILDRISKAMGIGQEYFEPVQMLRYENKGYYRLHLDNAYDDNPRKATFQIYLNDVAKGGETVFPKLGIAFRAKRGRAVMWYNFLDDAKAHENAASKLTSDPETLHEGAAVEEGEKFSFTQWIKLRKIGEPLRPVKMTVL